MADYLPVPTKEDYEIAAKNGLKKSTVYQRINYQGMTVEEAITKPLQNRSFSKKYQKYIELAKQNGINYPTFHARLTKKSSRNWTPEEAATVPAVITGRPRKEMNYQLPTEEEIKQAEAIGVRRVLLDQRLRQGWTMERAISYPVGTSYEGLEKHTKLLKLAKRTGISESTFYRRIREGMTPYQAASTPKEEKYVEYVTLAEQNGIARKTFYKRVERNMEPLEAATKPTKKRKKVQQIS